MGDTQHVQLFTKSPQGVNGDVELGISLGRGRCANLVMGGFPTFTIVPFAIAWPYVNDANGIAYPAGLLGIRQKWYPGHATDYSNSDFDLIPVPSVLPAGYTPRKARAHNLRPGVTSGFQGQGFCAQGFSPLPPMHATINRHVLRMDGGGSHFYYYMPEARGDDAYSANVGSSAWSFYPTAGFRYIQWKGVWPATTVELRCNADGSRTGTGTIVLATYTNGGAVKADSPLFTAGLSFPLGVRRYVYFRINPAPPDVITLLAGPRVDLPLPWSVSGVGLFAPGGYVASALDLALPT